MDAAFGNLRRGLTIARDGGCRQIESPIAAQLSRLAARHGKFVDALDYIRLSIRYQYDSGGVYQMKAPLAVLVLLFYRLGDYQTAATIAGFVATEYTSTSVPGTATTLERLRDVLGDGAYESLARRGEEMTAAAIANYAFDQIDRARSQLSSTGAPK